VLAASLVSKGLSARPKTVARATEALLLLVELDAADAATARALTLLFLRRTSAQL
jgi:hypothetical protein